MTTLVTGLAVLSAVFVLFWRIRYLKGLIAEQEQQLVQVRMVVADLAHDMRTPLTLLSGPIRDLLDGSYGHMEPRTVRVFERAYRNADRLECLMGKLMSDSGRHSSIAPCNAVVECVDVAQTVRGIVDQFHAHAVRSGVALEFDSGDRELVVKAECQAVERVATNLIFNAVKFTPSGGHVRVGVYTGGIDENVILEVQDSGCGISTADRERLFQRYFKGEWTTRSSAGWGMGLNIVRRLVQDMQGTVEVDSHPGEGSRFTVVLPRVNYATVHRLDLPIAVDGGGWIPEMSLESLTEVRSAVVSNS